MSNYDESRTQSAERGRAVVVQFADYVLKKKKASGQAQETSAGGLAVLANASLNGPVGRPLFDGKLTKRALLALPDGVYLVSNCMVDVHTPMVARHIKDAAAREFVWTLVRLKRLNGTLFRAFSSQRDYKVWRAFSGGRRAL